MTRRELTLKHIAAQAQIRGLTAAKIKRIWRNLGSYNREDVPRWLDQVIPVVLAAQRQSVTITDAYLAEVMGRRPLGLNPDDLVGRSGVTLEDEYSRPMTTVWAGLGDGKEWETARTSGAIDATRLVVTDIQMAMRNAAFAVGQQDKNIFGWKRVPNPGACELCMIASTQRYTTGHLMPIHDRCGCGIAPLTTSSGSIINRDLYRDLKADGAMDHVTRDRQVGGFERRAQENRDRAEYWRGQIAGEQDPARRVRLADRADSYDARAAGQAAKARGITARNVTVSVREHGELGPILVKK